MTPLGRLETAEDLAGAAVFLVSDERRSSRRGARSINVNGGAFMEQRLAPARCYR
ncbi:MAG: hypothetical protein R3C32_11775 [Chloroflexota bacterium]